MREGIKIKHFRQFTCEPLKGKNVFKVQNECCRVMDELRLHWWLSAGSVLGLIREPTKYILYDTDIDVEVWVKEDTDFNKIIKTFKSKGLELIRTMRYEGKIMQIAFIGEQNIIFDIYFYYPDGDNLVNENEHGTLTLPKYFVEARSIKHMYPLPHPVEEYLVYRYGKDWRVPTGAKGAWQEQTGECMK